MGKAVGPRDDIDDKRPPPCRRKSSRGPASPLALTLATYVSPRAAAIERRDRLTLCDTESPSPPAEAESLAHERPPEQEDRIRQGRREGGFRVCVALPPKRLHQG